MDLKILEKMNIQNYCKLLTLKMQVKTKKNYRVPIPMYLINRAYQGKLELLCLKPEPIIKMKVFKILKKNLLSILNFITEI